MHARPHLTKLVERVRLLAPLPAALVFPVDAAALQFALSGAFAGYLAPTLVGPDARIRDVANRAGLDISRLPIADAPDDPRAAAGVALRLARDGVVAALVKGSLRDDELLAPVAAPDSGLRTHTRLSHACVLDLPGFARPLVLADAQLNVAPSLAAKRDILINTIALSAALGAATPRVALLAAVDGPSQAFASTTDAVALCAMAAQGKFGPAMLAGPMTPDQALVGDSLLADAGSEVAGNADVLIAPGMEAAVMVLRTLTALTGGLAAGIVLGAGVPIVLPARRDTMEARMAACVVAALLVAARASAAATVDAAAAAPAARPLTSIMPSVATSGSAITA